MVELPKRTTRKPLIVYLITAGSLTVLSLVLLAVPDAYKVKALTVAFLLFPMPPIMVLDIAGQALGVNEPLAFSPFLRALISVPPYYFVLCLPILLDRVRRAAAVALGVIFVILHVLIALLATALWLAGD